MNEGFVKFWFCLMAALNIAIILGIGWVVYRVLAHFGII